MKVSRISYLKSNGKPLEGKERPCCKIRYLKLNYSEIIVYLCAVVRNNTGRSSVLFTQFLPMEISCQSVVQYYISDTDIDTVKIQNISISLLPGSLL